MMVSSDRRSFLMGGVSLASAAVLSSVIARAASIAPDVRKGTIADVEHVVILMQENRSFDHYFGTMAGVNGFGDRFPIPLPPLQPGDDARPVWMQRGAKGRMMAPFHLATRANFDLMRVMGTPHNWKDAQPAWDDGRMADWPAAKTPRSMGYFQREDIGFQFALAEAFTLCDAYHCAIQAGTNPNRVMLWTGSIDPAGRAGGPAIANSHDNLPHLGGWKDPYRWTSYAERLQAAGVDWRIYQDMADNFTDNPLAGFEAYRRAFAKEAGADPELLDRALTTHSMERFRADILAGQLPRVSYMIAPAALSEHPGPSSPAQGALYTAQVLDALTANPAIWARTALFVMYDENDGFFDHVPPPAPPARRDAPEMGGSTVSTEGEYHLFPAPGDVESDLPLYRGRPYGLGPRVPMFVISPWSRGGWINSQVFDHTSVIRFLEQRFGVEEPNITPWRRAICGDLTSCFDFSQQAAALSPLPNPAADARRAATIARQPSPDAPDRPMEPMQEPGIRPSRALPYHLEVTESVRGDGIDLHFHNLGQAAAVFHVYDRRALDKTPRRYTVTPGQMLSGHWANVQERYDLWILGPNGFHRHFAGGVDPSAPVATWTLDAPARRLSLHVRQGRVQAVGRTSGMLHGAWTGRENEHHMWDLNGSQGWYDLTLTDPDMPGYVRRLAGRVDNGQDSITDPARG